MATYLLCHRHTARECRVAFAAWNGVDSPLRQTPVTSSCAAGDHRLWFRVTAEDPAAALAQVPPYLAARTEVTEVTEVMVP